MSEERPPADGEVAIPGGRQGPDLKPRLGRSDSSEVHAQEDETEKIERTFIPLQRLRRYVSDRDTEN